MEEFWQRVAEYDWTGLLLTQGVVVLRILAIIIAARLVTRLGNRAIDRFFESRDMDNKRSQTFRPLGLQLWRYLVFFVTILIILEQLAVNLAPILAAAGVAGIAVGFGAQRLVRDLITGFFLLLEDQYAVGDYITIGSYTGIVEEVGLRVTRMRDYSGDLHILPNGNVETVTNHTRGSYRALVDISVAYEENIDRVIAVLEELCAELAGQHPEITEGPTVMGVVNLGDSEVVVRLWARTEPLQHWPIERAIRLAVKKRFDREGIEIPYPRRVIYQRETVKPPAPAAETEQNG